LAVEEAVKAACFKELVDRGSKSQFSDPKTIKELLTRHTLRHAVALTKSQPPPWWASLLEGLVVFMAALSLPEDVRLAAFQSYSVTKAADHAAQLPKDWPDRAKGLKESGMYTDFVSGAWRSPKDVNEREYLNLHRQVEVFIRRIGQELGFRKLDLPFGFVKTPMKERDAQASARAKQARHHLDVDRGSRTPTPES
jgi:AbiV family abortive infection protein